MIILVALDRQNHGDLLAFNQREHIDDWLATRGATTLRHFPNFEPIHPTAIGEAQNNVMGVRNEECVNPIFILSSCSLLAATATFLGAIFTQWLTLHVTSI